jgi:MFS transporter, FHS family, L-fucose permease
MAIVGGAVLTPLMGLIAEARHSIAPAFVVPLVAYVYIAGYAFTGAKVRDKGDTLQIQSRV